MVVAADAGLPSALVAAYHGTAVPSQLKNWPVGPSSGRRASLTAPAAPSAGSPELVGTGHPLRPSPAPPAPRRLTLLARPSCGATSPGSRNPAAQLRAVVTSTPRSGKTDSAKKRSHADAKDRGEYGDSPQTKSLRVAIGAGVRFYQALADWALGKDGASRGAPC